MDTVKPVKIGDEVPLSTKDGKPRKGHKSTPKDIEWMKQQVNCRWSSKASWAPTMRARP